MLLRKVATLGIAGLTIMVAAGLAALWAVGDSRAAEKAAKGWLGVSVRELTPSAREQLKLGNETGLLVIDVLRDSPADDAGIKEEDVILQFDGQKVEQADDLSRLVRNAGADKKVTLIVMRAGERKTMEVMLGKRRSPGYASAFGHGFGPGKEMTVFMNRPRLGVQVHELDEDLATYFKVEPRSGVLVLAVNEDSPAAKAGLKSGDVITKVDTEIIRDAEDLIQSLQDYEEGDQAKIEYVRQGKRETVTVEIDQSAGSGFRWLAPGGERIRARPFGADDWREAQLEASPDDFDLLMENHDRSQIDRDFHREIERAMPRAAIWGDRTL
ncbi:MAG: PDZ domain-containing protein [bacterium]